MKLFTRILAILALIASLVSGVLAQHLDKPPSGIELKIESPRIGVMYDASAYEFRTVSITPMTLSYQEEPPTRTWAGAVYWDFKSKTSSAILTYPVTTFTRIFGTSFSLDLLSFAGVTIEDQPSGLGGFILGKSGKIADQVTGFFGIGFPVLGNVPKSFGLSAGINVKI